MALAPNGLLTRRWRRRRRCRGARVRELAAGAADQHDQADQDHGPHSSSDRWTRLACGSTIASVVYHRRPTHHQRLAARVVPPSQNKTRNSLGLNDTVKFLSIRMFSDKNKTLGRQKKRPIGRLSLKNPDDETDLRAVSSIHFRITP